MDISLTKCFIKGLCFFLLMLLISTLSFSQITNKVINQNQKPITDLKARLISNEGTIMEVETDRNGNFILDTSGYSLEVLKQDRVQFFDPNKTYEVRVLPYSDMVNSNREIIIRINESISDNGVASEDRVPPYLNYSGFIKDEKGNPVNGRKNIAFRIFNQPTGGVELWKEKQEVYINEGRFAVLLGINNPIRYDLFNAPNRFISVQIEGDVEMLPRHKIVSVGYAIQAQNAENARNSEKAKLAEEASHSLVADNANTLQNHPVATSSTRGILVGVQGEVIFDRDNDQEKFTYNKNTVFEMIEDDGGASSRHGVKDGWYLKIKYKDIEGNIVEFEHPPFLQVEIYSSRKDGGKRPFRWLEGRAIDMDNIKTPRIDKSGSFWVGGTKYDAKGKNRVYNGIETNHFRLEMFPNGGREGKNSPHIIHIRYLAIGEIKK